MPPQSISRASSNHLRVFDLGLLAVNQIDKQKIVALEILAANDPAKFFSNTPKDPSQYTPDYLVENELNHFGINHLSKAQWKSVLNC
jgi:hypothetical protein